MSFWEAVKGEKQADCPMKVASWMFGLWQKDVEFFI